MKLILSIALFFVSSIALASGYMGEDDRGGKVTKCMHKSWKASEPSKEQTDKAKEFMSDAKKVSEENKGAVEHAGHMMMEAWGAHPISRELVVQAEENMRAAISPSREALRDASINTLNLLTAEQREKFNDAFHECMHD